ncbi:MAG TPA: hypothetical protein VM755_02515 [Stellaceae bacterium]|nr:hypothetical protein [Stellaceae bacterium]
MQVRRAMVVLGIAALAGCSGPQLLEDSPQAVTVRYDAVVHGLADATRLAGEACARHGKAAKLRKVDYEGLGVGERFAHFDCI